MCTDVLRNALLATALAMPGPALSVAQASAAQPPVRDTTLVAWYPMDGNADDSSSHALHGRLFGAVPCEDRYGNPAGALAFDGYEDFVSLPAGQALDVGLGDLSVSVWVRTRGPVGTLRQSVVCLRGADRGPRLDLYTVLDRDNAFLGCDAQVAGVRPASMEVCYAAMRDGRWHHLAVAIHNGVRGCCRLYLDGNSVGSVTVDGSLSGWLVARAGGDHDFAPQYFSGSLDDLRVWRRALTEAEVRDLASRKGQDSAPLAAPKAQTAALETGAFPGFTIMDSNVVFSAYKVERTADRSGTPGAALRFNGMDSRLQVERQRLFGPRDDYSMLIWFNVERLPPRRGPQSQMLFLGDDRGGKDPFSIAVWPDGSLQVYVEDNTKGADVQIPIETGRWYYLAVTYRRTARKLSVYLDATLVKELQTDVLPVCDLLPGANPSLGIGNHGGYPRSPHQQPFCGAISGVRVLKRCLSDEEVRAADHPESALKQTE